MFGPDASCDNRHLRHLGALERYSLARSRLGIYQNVCLTASFTSSTPIPSVHRALAEVVQEHPVLYATVKDTKTTSPTFARLDAFDLNHVVTTTRIPNPLTQDDMHEIIDKTLETLHNTPFRFEANLPLWKVRILDSTAALGRAYLCFCFHHSLLDTQSAVLLMVELSQALSRSNPGEDAIEIQPPRGELPPPLESMVNVEISDEYCQTQRNPVPPPKNLWSGAVQWLPVSTRLQSLYFDRDASARLVELCKRERTSVTAMIMALLACSFFQVLPAEYTLLRGDCAVSLRRFLPEGRAEKSLGCYVGSVRTEYSRSAGSLLNDATKTKESIMAALERRGKDMPVGYLCEISDLHTWLQANIGRKREAAWELSNVGSLEGTCTESGKPGTNLEHMLFSQSASACSGAIKVSVATGRNGQLCMCFSWQRGIVEDGLVQNVISTFHRKAVQTCNEKSENGQS